MTYGARIVQSHCNIGTVTAFHFASRSHLYPRYSAAKNPRHQIKNQIKMIKRKDEPVADEEEERSMISESTVTVEEERSAPPDGSRVRSATRHKISRASRSSESEKSWNTDSSWGSEGSGDWNSTMEVQMESMYGGCWKKTKWFVNLQSTFCIHLSNAYALVLLSCHKGGKY